MDTSAALFREVGAPLSVERITRTYQLDEINRGYADLEAGRNLRADVTFDR